MCILTSFSDLGIDRDESTDFAADVIVLVGRNEVMDGQVGGLGRMVSPDPPDYLVLVRVGSRDARQVRNGLGKQRRQGEVGIRCGTAPVAVQITSVAKRRFRFAIHLNLHEIQIPIECILENNTRRRRSRSRRRIPKTTTQTRQQERERERERTTLC